MTRPIYETSENRKNERLAAKELAEIFDCQVVQNKKLYPADYSLVRNGKVSAIGEIKVRTCSKDKYSTFFISADKIHKCKNFAREFKLQFFLFVWWSDGLYGLNLMDTETEKLTIGGRFDRGDSQDVEPMAHYDTSIFKPLIQYG